MSSITSAEQSKHELLEQRLNKAKKQVTIDTNNVASAKLMMDNAIAMFASAKSQLGMSKKEVEEAEAMLKSTEDKIAAEQGSIIDQNPAAEKQSEGSNNNKRKKEEDSNHAYDQEH